MGLIYMRISPSGGKYIGKTILSEYRRWQGHCNGAFNPKSSDYNCILSQAIRKYGKDSFTVEILEDNIPNEKLNEREQYWIGKYNTYFKSNSHGYNMTYGGEGAQKFLDEELLSLWNNGLSLKEISLVVGSSSHYLGTRLQQLGIDPKLFKIRAAQKRAIETMKNNPKNKMIYELWQQGLSLCEIRKKIVFDISSASKMLQKIYNISNEEIQQRKNKTISSSKKQIVLQYDLQDNFIKEWSSATDAAKALNLNCSSIRSCITGKRKTCGGYKWKNKI